MEILSLDKKQMRVGDGKQENYLEWPCCIISKNSDN